MFFLHVKKYVACAGGAYNMLKAQQTAGQSAS